MPRYMIVTSVFLFWAFYEMSGGADFQPPMREEAVVADAQAETPPEPPSAIFAAPARAPEPVREILTASYSSEPVLIEAAIAAAEAEDPTPVAAPTPLDIRFVAGDWVNMRDGPSTAYNVLDTLPRGTEAEVIEVNDRGWAQIRLIESGQTGWMAERLLSDR